MGYSVTRVTISTTVYEKDCLTFCFCSVVFVIGNGILRMDNAWDTDGNSRNGFGWNHWGHSFA